MSGSTKRGARWAISSPTGHGSPGSSPPAICCCGCSASGGTVGSTADSWKPPLGAGGRGCPVREPCALALHATQRTSGDTADREIDHRGQAIVEDDLELLVVDVQQVREAPRQLLRDGACEF